MAARNSPLITTLIAVIFVFGGIFLIIGYQQAQNMQTKNAKVIPVVAQNAVANTTQTTENFSPDGTMKLVMKTEVTKGNAHIYTFTTSDAAGKNTHQIFTKTISSGTMTIPLNSWSPDNTYVFIQENTNAFVFKASGETFANNQQYLDVTSLFTQRITQYIFKEATGWAAPTLLIFTTANTDGTKGSSYWFEVDNQSFIQLANH